jgi:Peptidase family M48
MDLFFLFVRQRFLIFSQLFLFMLFWCTPCLATLQSLPLDHPTTVAVSKVYKTVARSFGEGRQPPRLVIVPRENSLSDIAREVRGSDGLAGTASRHDEGYIVLNEKAYDVLKSVNVGQTADRLAFVLGHELAHYYLRHGWVGNFGHAFTGSKVGLELSQALPSEQVMAFEVQADYLGGVYSYLAGYDSLNTAGETLDLLYANFKVSARQRPTLAQRKETLTLARRQLDRLVPAFDAATVLMLLGQYEDAIRLYDYLAGIAPSKELPANAGVARIHEALGLFGYGEMKGLFPVDLDTGTKQGFVLSTKYHGVPQCTS